MDPKLILVRAIVLLYKESLNPSKTENSSGLVKEVLTYLRAPENTMETDTGRETHIALRSTLNWMTEQPLDYVFDQESLIQRIRINIRDDEALFAAAKIGIESECNQDELLRQCLSHRADLNTFIRRQKIKELIKRKASEILYQEEDNIDWRNVVPALITELESLNSIVAEAKITGVVDEINFEDINSIRDAFQRGIAESGTDGVLRTGWQCINRMTGDTDGFRRGEMVVVGALQHNNKTGFTLNLFKQFALYNKPYMLNPHKKPLLIHISAEDSVKDNLKRLYVSLMENLTGELCDITAVDDAEASQFVHEQLGKNGYNIKMYRVDPSDFGYRDLFDLLLKLEAEGYEIHALVIDYLNMFNKRGCISGGPMGFDTRDLFRRVRNFTNPRGILCITPHQLSSEAKNLIKMGVKDFVKEIANKGYWDSCRVLDQEVDMEIYIHIELVNMVKYQTIQRGKHRGKIHETPLKDLHAIMQFHSVGGLKDDLGKQDLTVRHMGAGGSFDGDDAGWLTQAWGNAA